MNKAQLTAERDLRESHPLWLDSPRISVRTKSAPSTRSYDIIVVGAGISGALVAHALASKDRSILIVDRRSPVHGSSMASTAMIQHEIDVPLHKLQAMIGEKEAARAWQRSAQAVLKLEEIVRALSLSCGMRRKKALYLAGDSLGARALKTEAEARGAAGIEAEYLDAATLRARYGLERTAAILSDISASANPAQLTAGLLRNLNRQGAEIVEGVEITDLKSFGESNVLATADGHLLSAPHVVFCTGYEFLEMLAHKNHRIISTWAIAARPESPPPDWLNDHLIWEASDPYLYLRTEQSGRLIAGGEDEESDEAYLSAAKLRDRAETIRRKTARLLGCRIGKPEYRWAAAFGSTDTGLPMIGAVPGMTGVYSVMGFGGNGITFSQIAAELIAAAVNGAEDPDAGLFSFR